MLLTTVMSLCRQLPDFSDCKKIYCKCFFGKSQGKVKYINYLKININSKMFKTVAILASLVGGKYISIIVFIVYCYLIVFIMFLYQHEI